MKIYLASYQGIALNQGGPTFKLKQMLQHLKKLGIDAQLYDMWQEDIKPDEQTLFHIFNASIATYTLAANLLNRGFRYLVNPIFFSNHPAKIIKSYLNLEKALSSILPRSYSDYRMTGFVCKHAAHVLPNTSAEAELLINALGVDSSRVSIIPNGVESRFYQADPGLFQKKYALRDFVLYVGHLGPPRKNCLKIIKALGQIDHPAVIIADVINNKEGTQCLEEMKKHKNIHYLGWIDHDDPMLESAYAACSTFALPTRYETPGRAALEAALTGANIVITPRGGTRDYFTDKAIYIDPDSISSIKNGIEKSLQQSRQEDLRQHVWKNYIWEKIAADTIEIYRKILAE
ncbi:MAG: glycosyltransferase family 4 protein [Candidatus Cloacimonetes bacterium]|nr:glycosyltransferase family 4 protein [Candidatus Cloacimonadota bacterium]